MSGERRTEKRLALVCGVDGRGRRFSEYRMADSPLPLSDEHAARGERLRRARIDAGLTLRDAGTAAGVDFPRLSRIEHGHEEASADEWARLWVAVGRQS